MATEEEAIGCLEKALSAYKEAIPSAEIREAYSKLQDVKSNANASDLAQQLDEFRRANIYDREAFLKAKQLSQIRTLESINDGMERAQKFLDKKVPNPGYQALKAKLTGTKHANVNDAANSTDTNVNRARQSFYTRFNNDLKDGKVMDAFQDISEENQIALAEAVLRRNRGESVSGKLDDVAKIIRKYSDQVDDGLTSQGVLTPKLKSRASYNVHDPRLMLKLTREERRLPENQTPEGRYDYAYKRWRDFTTPLLNKERVFDSRGIDPEKEDQLDEFMRPAFDNLANKGKASQRDTNIGTRNSQARVLDWKDGESTVHYNNRFGSGSLQHNIMMEIMNGFKDIEILKHWGETPVQTLRKTMAAIDEKAGFDKVMTKRKNIDNLEHLMEGLVSNDTDYSGSLGVINKGLKNIAVMAKLGMITFKSIQDLSSVANEATRAGLNPISATVEMAKAFGRFIYMTDAQKKYIGNVMDNSRSMEMSAHMNTYNLSPYNIKNILDKGAQAMMKYSLIHRWDYAMRSSSHAIWSQYFAKLKDTDYDKIDESERNMLATYGVHKPMWDLIQKSPTVRMSKGQYFSPELVQEVPNDQVKEMLRASGKENPTDYDVEQFKLGTEQTLLSFMYDRADHVVQRPNLSARQWISPGFIKNDVARFVVDQMMVFKSFGISYTNRNLGEKLFERGAKTMGEALNPFSGTQNLFRTRGSMATLLVRNMALGYAGKTLINLALGQSPPSLKSGKVWTELAADSAGFYTAMLGLDSVTGLLGPTFSTASKVEELIRHQITGKGKKALNKDAYKLASTNLPFNNLWLTNYLIKNTLLGDWQDSAEPGIRQKRLAQLKQEEGVHTLWNQQSYLHPAPYEAIKKLF